MYTRDCVRSVLTKDVCYMALSNNQINARALIGQSAMIYCASEPMEISASSELLYRSNRPKVSMAYRHDKPLGMLEKHSKNS